MKPDLDMPTTPPAAFYDDLAPSLAEAQRLIAEGAANRKVAAHNPVVASIDAGGAPTQRVMILRHLDWANRRLRFHTDARSAKAAEFASNSSASVLFYEPEPKIQLRLSGTADVIIEGDASDLAWNGSTNFARRCYLAEASPGASSSAPTSGLPSAIEGRQPDDAEIAAGRANFAILLFQFNRIEWLYLANSGHRRARWVWDSAHENWTGTWLVP
jgi:pyridoxamine 5'-phosphate oxidase